MIHFLRAAVLLTALIAVPGTAVCWNLLPKNFFEGFQTASDSKEAAPEQDYQTMASSTFPVPAKAEEDLTLQQVRLLEPALDEKSMSSSRPTPPKLSMPDFDFPFATAESGAIRTMSHRDDGSSVSVIPTDISSGQTVWAHAQNEESMPTLPEQAMPNPAYAQQLTPIVSPDRHQPAPLSGHETPLSEARPRRDFPSLEQELKGLGAKYYRLEKWGSRGEMFRFSCYVSPMSHHQYQKYFQAIDNDEIRVMEQVVDEIRRWKEQ